MTAGGNDWNILQTILPWIHFGQHGTSIEFNAKNGLALEALCIENVRRKLICRSTAFQSSCDAIDNSMLCPQLCKMSLLLNAIVWMSRDIDTIVQCSLINLTDLNGNGRDNAQQSNITSFVMESSGCGIVCECGRSLCRRRKTIDNRKLFSGARSISTIVKNNKQ